MFQARDDPQQRRLARSGRTKKRDQLAARDVEVDALQRFEGPKGLRDSCSTNTHRSSIRQKLKRKERNAARRSSSPFIVRKFLV
jgi:hypothetical protein